MMASTSTTTTAKNLLYVLVNYSTEHYLGMFEVYLESLTTFSDCSKFDLLIICDRVAHAAIQSSPTFASRLSAAFQGRVHYLKVPVDKELKQALLRKMDVVKFRDFLKYDRIVYTDIDIIVQGDLSKVFSMVPKLVPGKLYATEEGELDGEYWTLNAYKNSDFNAMRKDHVKSFNSGFYMFKPCKEMAEHLKEVRKLGQSYVDKKYFYDQSVLNYYFNMRRLSVTSAKLKSIYVMFPDEHKYYDKAIILHVAGIGRYAEKSKLMRDYYDFILRHKKPEFQHQQVTKKR
jgi:lipopolysaccharide biosynthesis glycosyltransferase